VYALIGEKFYIEELKVKFNFIYYSIFIDAYQNFMEIRNNKNNKIPKFLFHFTPLQHLKVIAMYKRIIWRSSN
jgi:hypothetical protein